MTSSKKSTGHLALRRQALALTFFKFEHYYLTTAAFYDRWSGYFASIQKSFEKCFLETSDSAFLMLIGDLETKTQGKHYSEIFNFEK